jgi:cardiolipin synthase
METFIWKDDRIGHRIREALEERARAGVRVFVITDGFANLKSAAGFRHFGAPLHHLVFREPSLSADGMRVSNLLRDHRKILVVDEDVAFIGGYNIDDRCADGHWRDTHLRLRGDSVRELRNAFVEFWNENSGARLPALPEVAGRSWKPNVTVHRNDPSLRIFPVRGMYLEAIDRARESLWLTHAYFVPDRALRRALIAAARRGVDVQVILPWHSNHVLADWVARRYFAELLRAGVRIFAYRRLMIHAKTATIDGQWSTVGTANMDRLSLQGNYEVNIEITSERLAAQMQAMFLLDRDNCTEIDYRQWQRRPLRARFAERALEGLAPLV